MPVSSAGTFYEVFGQEARPWIVLIHGLGLRRETWRDHVPVLAKNYRVLTFDLYGHGESALPPETPSVQLFSEQIIDLMDELGIDNASMVGFSLGGMINRRLAMDHPKRVSSLVVLNSPHDRGEEAQRLVEERAADTSSGGPGATLDATIERWFTSEFREERPDIIAEIRHWVLANNPESYAACRKVLAHGVKELIKPQPPISKPTLVITCENDSGSTPKMSYDIASEIDGAETIIVPHLQHMGLMEQPDLFTSPVNDFLNRTFN